jgi:hypothetical protein
LPAIVAGGLLQVDARAGRVVAVGATGSEAMPEWLALERQPSGAWTTLAQPATAFTILPFDVALDPMGRAVFACNFIWRPGELQTVVWDERTQNFFEPTSIGLLQAVAFGAGDTVRAVGTRLGGLAWRSSSPGNWQEDDLGIPSSQEAGLVDLAVSNGDFYACGFNDGSLQPVILLRNRGTSWESIPVGNFSTIEFRAVSADSNGAVWLGGIDHAADPPAAFLARRPANGDLFEVVLPPMTGPVREILVASNGDVYLATGNEDAHILRWNGTAWVTEITRANARILALAEGTGLIFAVGVASFNATSPQPLVLERTI